MAEDWKKYIADLKASWADDTADTIAGLRPQEVLVPGHEVDISTLGGRRSHLGKMAHLAVEMGWEVKVGESEYFSGDVLQKNGKVRKGKFQKMQWFEAARPGVRIKMQTAPNFTGSEPIIKINGKHVSLEEFEAKIKEEA